VKLCLPSVIRARTPAAPLVVSLSNDRCTTARSMLPTGRERRQPQDAPSTPMRLIIVLIRVPPRIR
jgi:hypothetical protein